MMYELVYADKDVEVIIKKRFPQAVIENASDEIHRERFQVNIEGVTEDEFYPFAIREGFARCCLGFEIILNDQKNKDNKVKIEHWIELAKEAK